MDRIYRYQRFFYDATRIFFLPGRDRLINAIDAPAGAQILEMGCGTARNLIKLAKRFPRARFFGVDISKEMLRTANRKIRETGLSSRVAVAESPAEAVHHSTTFGLDNPFDAVIFSYSLSMMPTFENAIKAAKATVTPTGALFAVDFWDAGGWPKPMRSLLVRWLSLFHVRFDKTIHTEICRTFPETEIRGVKGRYAFIAAPRSH
jgi:S-adenosylmethionine-diacylgycerolhomoserine-N-methlytransferase